MPKKSKIKLSKNLRSSSRNNKKSFSKKKGMIRKVGGMRVKRRRLRKSRSKSKKGGIRRRYKSKGGADYNDKPNILVFILGEKFDMNYQLPIGVEVAIQPKIKKVFTVKGYEPNPPAELPPLAAPLDEGTLALPVDALNAEFFVPLVDTDEKVQLRKSYNILIGFNIYVKKNTESGRENHYDVTVVKNQLEVERNEQEEKEAVTIINGIGMKRFLAQHIYTTLCAPDTIQNNQFGRSGSDYFVSFDDSTCLMNQNKNQQPWSDGIQQFYNDLDLATIITGNQTNFAYGFNKETEELVITDNSSCVYKVLFADYKAMKKTMYDPFCVRIKEDVDWCARAKIGIDEDWLATKIYKVNSFITCKTNTMQCPEGRPVDAEQLTDNRMTQADPPTELVMEPNMVKYYFNFLSRSLEYTYEADLVPRHSKIIKGQPPKAYNETTKKNTYGDTSRSQTRQIERELVEAEEIKIQYDIPIRDNNKPIMGLNLQTLASIIYGDKTKSTIKHYKEYNAILNGNPKGEEEYYDSDGRKLPVNWYDTNRSGDLIEGNLLKDHDKPYERRKPKNPCYFGNYDYATYQIMLGYGRALFLKKQQLQPQQQQQPTPMVHDNLLFRQWD